ncbi:hypothetical protein GCM10028791_24530 [Echinicola sediminis]
MGFIADCSPLRQKTEIPTLKQAISKHDTSDNFSKDSEFKEIPTKTQKLTQ